jgi:drug/metabolite transporter (DMT)-like permease
VSLCLCVSVSLWFKILTNKSHTTGLWLALIAAFSFSMKAIFIKLAYQWPIEAVTLLALRMAFSLPFFVVVGLRESRKAEPLSTQQWFVVVLLGLLGYYGASIFDFIGLHYITASLERLILFSYPTLTLIFGAVFFGQPITRRDIAAVLFCYVGIAAAFAHDLQMTEDMNTVLIGGGFVMASSICYAAYLLGSGRIIPIIGSARFTALAMLVSTGATLLHFLLTQPLAALVQPWQVYALSAAMAIFSTVLPVFALSAAIRRIGASHTALIANVGPVLTIIMSWWILGESISLWQWVGTAMVVAGVVIVGKK